MHKAFFRVASNTAGAGEQRFGTGCQLFGADTGNTDICCPAIEVLAVVRGRQFGKHC